MSDNKKYQGNKGNRGVSSSREDKSGAASKRVRTGDHSVQKKVEGLQVVNMIKAAKVLEDLEMTNRVQKKIEKLQASRRRLNKVMKM